MIGFDTCAIIDLINGDEGLLKLIDSLDEEICLTRISYFELVFGINPKIKSHLEEEKFYDNLFSTLRVLEMDNFCLKKASRLFWELKSSGLEIGRIDALISFTFLNNGVDKIITRNKKHFERIKGLKVLEY